MVVTTTTSAGGFYLMHEGTQQEVLDAMETTLAAGNSYHFLTAFHNNTNYTVVLKAK